MAEHLHNIDAAKFMLQAMMWLEAKENMAQDGLFDEPLHCTGRNLSLVWRQGDDTRIMPYRLNKANQEVIDRLAQLADCQPLPAGEQLGFYLTRFQGQHRMRVGFNLVRLYGDTTLVITEHMTRANQHRKPKEAPPVYATELLYQGYGRKQPAAALALFKEYIEGPEVPELAPPSPYVREIVKNAQFGPRRRF